MKQSRRCRVRKHKRTLKRRNKKKMRGGLFTVDGGDAWAAVIKMMGCEGAALSMISYSSLYGFILLLSIPEVSGYAKFKDENGNLVYKIVLKIVLLDDNKNKVALPRFMGTISKSTMNTHNFSNEALKQQLVFKEYISTEEAPFKKQSADISIEEGASVKKRRANISIEEGASVKKRRANIFYRRRGYCQKTARRYGYKTHHSRGCM